MLMFNLLCLLGQQVHADVVNKGSSFVPRTPKNRCVGGYSYAEPN